MSELPTGQELLAASEADQPQQGGGILGGFLGLAALVINAFLPNSQIAQGLINFFVGSEGANKADAWEDIKHQLEIQNYDTAVERINTLFTDIAPQVEGLGEELAGKSEAFYEGLKGEGGLLSRIGDVTDTAMEGLGNLVADSESSAELILAASTGLLASNAADRAAIDAKFVELGKANRAQGVAIIAGFQSRLTSGLSMLEGLGEQTRKDINRSFTSLGTQLGQDLVSRGLTGTTQAPAVALGVERERFGALGSLEETLRGQAVGLFSDLSGQTLGAMERQQGIGGGIDLARIASLTGGSKFAANLAIADIGTQIGQQGVATATGMGVAGLGFDIGQAGLGFEAGAFNANLGNLERFGLYGPQFQRDITGLGANWANSLNIGSALNTGAPAFAASGAAFQG